MFTSTSKSLMLNSLGLLLALETFNKEDIVIYTSFMVKIILSVIRHTQKFFWISHPSQPSQPEYPFFSFSGLVQKQASQMVPHPNFSIHIPQTMYPSSFFCHLQS